MDVIILIAAIVSIANCIISLLIYHKIETLEWLVQRLLVISGLEACRHGDHDKSDY